MSSNIVDDWFMNEHQLPPMWPFGGLATPTGLDNFDLSIYDPAQDTNDSSMLLNNQFPYPSDAFDDLDLTHPQLFDIDLSKYIDLMAALPINNSIGENPPSTEETPITSFVMKSSEKTNTTKFINSNKFIQTGKFLQLTVPPFSYQRARYEKELNEILRYIFVADNASLMLTIPDLRDINIPNISYFVRITRRTMPYGPGNLIFCHPYPIWIKDKDGKVHNGSLFIPVTSQIMKIDGLVLSRLKQGGLGKIKQLSIFRSNKLDFNEFHLITKQKPKEMIKEYQLQYSILHFQIFLVDQHNNACPTDLECQTEPIYEFEGKELNNLPSNIRNIMKQSIKRKRIGQQKQSLIKINKKKATKIIVGPEWPHPPVNENLLST